jgi:TDG/mug DNA glycosylase family protein
MDRATLDVYERSAREWRDRRPARPERAVALARRIPAGVPRVDVGCGPGTYLPHLGRPVLGLDAAHAMLELAREVAPDAWLVQADLAALPLRDQSLGGALARASYLHIPRVELPAALAQLHRALRVDAPAVLVLRHGDAEGLLASDDFPGRFFAEWQPQELSEVMVGAGFDVEVCEIDPGRREWVHVRATRARTLPDYVGADMRLLVCGLNPSLYAADVGVGYGRPGNRFWPAALRAGLVTRDRDPVHALAHHRMGMTDLVKRATTGAAELTRTDYQEGAARVERLVQWLRPRAVCFVGLTGWRAAVDRKASVGEQPEGFGDARAYVMPNTSGINAHASLDDLAEHLRAAAALADRPHRS